MNRERATHDIYHLSQRSTPCTNLSWLPSTRDGASDEYRTRRIGQKKENIIESDTNSYTEEREYAKVRPKETERFSVSRSIEVEEIRVTSPQLAADCLWYDRADKSSEEAPPARIRDTTETSRRTEAAGPLNSTTTVSENIKIVFWNVHGWKNFIELTAIESHELLGKCALIGLCETWCTDKAVRLTNDLSRYNYITSPATKEYATGRASGGICVLYDK